MSHANRQADLRRAGIELGEIVAVANLHAQRHAVVPLLELEPVSVQRLLQLAEGAIND